MLKTLMTLAVCFACLLVNSQDEFTPKPAADISKELRKDAHAVIQLDDGMLDVLSPSEYTLKVRQVITILDEKAAHHLRHRLGVDKFNKVEDVTVNVYDAAGKLSAAYTRKDFSLEAAFDGISLVTNNKVMELQTPAPGYPCTIDVQYKLRSTSYVELPNWFINYHNTSTELFRYKVKVPVNLDVRHRTINFTVTPKVETAGAIRLYSWETRNVPAGRLEAEGYEPARYLPQIEVAPNEFAYDGFKGSFRSWKDFGAWNYNLYEEKAAFDPVRVKDIQGMAASAATPGEKIKLLYRYLQKNMRYVSIQLGIGGFKPFAVKFVDEKKYGDCKALTNYMRQMLKAVGITSYPALINAGNNKLPADPAFPTDPFNHVILCIPGPKDTTWLECTSNNNEPGELGTFTENKMALLLTEEGGVLVSTPKSNYNKNKIVSYNQVTINVDGGATIRSRIKSDGESAAFYQYVTQLPDDERRERLVKELRYKSPEEFLVTPAAPATGMDLQVQRTYAKLYDFKAGNKFFFPLCINRMATEEVKPYRRETEFLFDFPFLKTDTTEYQFPQGLAVEAIPSDENFSTRFSTYSRTCHFDKSSGRLTVISTLQLKLHIIPALSYIEMAAFFKNVKAKEDESFVLTKASGELH